MATMAMQPSVAAQHSTLSYSKWDMLEDSDDEPDGKSKPLQPLLSGNKTFSQRDADEKAAQRFVKHIKDHLPATKPAHRELVSRYVAACSKGKQQTNIYRYSDICSFVTRVRHARPPQWRPQHPAHPVPPAARPRSTRPSCCLSP